MKKGHFKIAIIILGFLLLKPVYGDTYPFRLTVVGIPSDSGNIMLLIRNEVGDTVQREVVRANADSLTIDLNLPYGKYAIAVFHDENQNLKLDKSILGWPVEKYGFSNNARGVFGPPELNEQLITFNSSIRSHRITIE